MLYADCLERKYGRRPFIFLTNGYEVYFIDDAQESGSPRCRVGGVFTQDDLVRRMERRETGQSVANPKLDDNIAGRIYQREAVLAFCEALEHHQRRMLIVQATGTGKTRVAISITDVMTRYNRAKNILFLADRKALVKQAKTAFTEFFKNKLTLCNLLDNKEDPTTSRIVFSTYPTMMNAIDKREDDGRRMFSPGHFDLIIIDESHRSIYKEYQEIFDYFDAVLLGLTATPKSEVGRDTYRVFQLEDGVPTYNYDYETAVREGYLVDYELKTYTTKFLNRGLRYKDLSESEKSEFEDMFGVVAEDCETGRYDVESSAFNKWLFNKDTVMKVLARLMDEGIHIEGGDKLGKTIIFAKNTEHARFIVECFHEMYPELGDDFIQQADYSIDYAEDIVDRFKKTGANPEIAVSVDMLDTGIDVPDIVNLVFFKAVHSYSKFWQMIGRGTRLRPNLFGTGQDKDHFLIFDYGGNFAYFGEDRNKESNEKLPLSLSSRVFMLKARVAKTLQSVKDDELKKLHDEFVNELHAAVMALDDRSFIVKRHLRAVEKYRQVYNLNALNDIALAELKNEIAPLISRREDEKVRRFDHLMLSILLSAVEGAMDKADGMIAAAEGAANELAQPSMQNIPQVAAHRETIERIRHQAYWEDATPLDIESVRREIRSLMQYIKPKQTFYVYTDFSDEVQEGEGEKLRPPTASESYRQKVEFYLKEHMDNAAVYKLRHNEPMTMSDMRELERIFWQELGTREDYAQNYENEPLGELVRRIVGMDEESVRDAFREFLTENRLSRSQMDFVEKIIQYIARNGSIDVEPSKEPFRGVDLTKLFKDKESVWKKIFGRIKEITSKATFAA